MAIHARRGPLLTVRHTGNGHLVPALYLFSSLRLAGLTHHYPQHFPDFSDPHLRLSAQISLQDPF